MTPNPDALMVAKYVDEWPYVGEDPALFLYLYITAGGNRKYMYQMGYQGLCGVGRPGNKVVGRTAVVIPDSEYVKVQLVFVPDAELQDARDRRCMGRNITMEQWERARKWLQENSDGGEEREQHAGASTAGSDDPS